MDIYHFHAETKEYLRPGVADKSPLEHDVWLIPGNATNIKPPRTKSNEAAVFDGIEWKTVPDFRGASYWTSDGKKIRISKLNETVPDDASTEQPKVELTAGEKMAFYRDGLRRHLDAEAQSLGFDSILDGVTYADEPADPISQSQGKALRAWRSKCWKKCREELAKWQDGGAEPTVEDLIKSLPPFNLS